MNILVYEHVAGGGFAGEPLPGDILSEGFAMLRTLTCDLTAAGHRVTVTLDSRLKPLAALLNVERTLTVESKGKLLETLRACSLEAAYVIAPESGEALPSLIEAVEEAGLISFNCTPEAVRAVADKAEACRALASAGLNVPTAAEAHVGEDPLSLARKARDLGFPVVFKPHYGVSCAGLSLVKGVDQISAAVEKLKREAGGTRFLIQKFIRGVNASVSLIAAAHKASPLTLNMQRVKLASPGMGSSYEGGLVPLEHPLKNMAFRAAEKAVGVFNGLRGYVGVDLVLTRDKVYLMEVNPRLTTSYIGLRRVVGYNPAQAIIDAVVHGRLPGVGWTSGFAAFQKVRTSISWPLECSVEGILTPPLGNPAYAFIEAYGSTLRMARDRLYRVKRRLACGGKRRHESAGI
ncbi:MAG: ATP-grasp domain-containing protein [Nitrososphaerota archaeon]|nr:ATP-grasp domain-containing protein [Candidatus Bathyarchaeota archaeon]MDW8193635.1 ATP-grasp domain-containing protein [Nitrososphaerota archaeon]